MLIRGTGLVAYGLLAASTIWGLMLSSKVFGRLVKAKPLTYLHEGLAVGALIATGAHMLFLWTDDFVEFGPRELFIPGASGWEPLAVAFGIMAFYATVIVSFSFYVKKWIGQGVWRSIHYLGFGTFAAAAIHGIMAGTDTQHPAVLSLYVATVAIVVLLLVVRVTQEMATPAQEVKPRSRPMPATVELVAPDDGGSAGEEVAERLAALRARRVGSVADPSPAGEPVGSDGGVPSEMSDRLAALAARRAERAG
jgi:DMSO/TMAO reductase YedYZ heme-binding membrane subunit